MLRRRPASSRRPIPESICALPWTNLSVDVDGSTRPCCKFAHLEPDSPYQLPSLREHSLEDAWHDEAMQRLRRDFRAGIKPAECSTCWDEEAAGVASYRQTFAEYRGLREPVDFDDPTPPPPQALDLKLTNACNLKCRICGPVASSLWLQEELSLGDPEPGTFIAQLHGERTYYLSNKITRDDRNASELRRWLPTLRYLELTGGEPMLSPENRELIELIATEGHPEQVGILFNTNATVMDERILSHLDRFREVNICLSIDDVGERFEYERHPARWDEVEKNLDRYQEVAGERWRLFAFCSISVFNAWYLPEYLQWLGARHDKVPLSPVFNLVHYPRHFSVQVLPQPVKAALVRRLRARISGAPAGSPEVVEALADLVSFIEGARPDDAESWQLAVDTITERDAIRGQDARATFPELFEQLDAAGAWSPSPLPW